MKKVKVFFSISKKPSVSKMPKNSQKNFSQRLKCKDLDINKGFIEIFFENKNNITIFSHWGLETILNDDLQNLWASVIRILQKKYQSETFKIRLFFDKSLGFSKRFFVEKGILLTQFDDSNFKSKHKPIKFELNWIFHKELYSVVNAIDLARELVYQPANLITPESFEQYVKKNLEPQKELKISYFDKKFLEEEKMWLFLAVNQWSKYPAKMITMEYNPENSKEKPIILVGKGLTYDSWGYYMKPYPHMWEMFGDMAWAATVVWIMSALKKLWIKKRIIGAVGLTENMVDANSYTNWDLLIARNWKSVQVLHTDAEWRLVLADVLSYVCDKYEPNLVIDFATLTGACACALWEMYTWVFSGNEKLLEKIKKSGNKTNDLVWGLPRDKHCNKAIEWKIADINNVSSFTWILWASTAAAFLSNFVHDTKKRIHCDIAWTALRSQIKRDYDLPNWIWTGAMVHNILNFLKS